MDFHRLYLLHKPDTTDFLSIHRENETASLPMLFTSPECAEMMIESIYSTDQETASKYTVLQVKKIAPLFLKAVIRYDPPYIFGLNPQVNLEEKKMRCTNYYVSSALELRNMVFNRNDN